MSDKGIAFFFVTHKGLIEPVIVVCFTKIDKIRDCGVVSACMYLGMSTYA